MKLSDTKPRSAEAKVYKHDKTELIKSLSLFGSAIRRATMGLAPQADAGHPIYIDDTMSEWLRSQI
jgi:hypothetical protein